MIWIIGDIHGCLDPLNMVLNQIEKFNKQAEYKKPKGFYEVEKIIFIGDYIDFGPSSKEVIEKIQNLPFPCVYLMGNHEHTMYDFLYERDIYKQFGPIWLNQQGVGPTISSLASPVLDPVKDQEEIKKRIKADYSDFLNKLKYSHEETIETRDHTYHFLFVHGGVNENIPLKKQLSIQGHDHYYDYLKEEKLFFDKSILWERKQLKNKKENLIVVNGHTPHTSLPRYYRHRFGWQEDFKIPFFSFPTAHDQNENEEENHDDVLYEQRTNNCFRIDAKISDTTSINIDGGSVYDRYLLALGIGSSALENRCFYTISLDLTTRFGYRDKKILHTKEILFNKYEH